jgi:5-methylcytosine-specific restriction endonuclease McrA
MSEAWKAGSDTKWRRFRLTILERDQWRCTLQLAGCTTAATHVDHIQPLSKGGDKYDPSNCRASCRTCNLKRGDSGTIEQPEPRPVSTW